MSWISIKDNLPRDGAVVDVWMKSGYRLTDFTFIANTFDAKTNRFMRLDGAHNYYKDELSHWMKVESPAETEQ